MPENAIDLVILTDKVGNHYVLPRATLESARIPDEHKDDVAQLLAHADVSGFGGPYAMREGFGGSLSTMSEMSEMTSLRLQMTMDRKSKFQSALSNLLLNIATVQGGLTQSLK